MSPVEPLVLASAPAPRGPYSPAVKVGNWVVFSGQIGIVDAAADDDRGSVASTLRQLTTIMNNLFAMLAEMGGDRACIASMTMYLVDLSHFGSVNEELERLFGPHRPARTTVGVAGLPLGAMIEIQVWASVPEPALGS